MSTLLDSYASANADTTSSESATGAGRGQSFATPGTDYKLATIKMCIRNGSSGNGTAKAKLYSHSGTYGTSSVPTEAIGSPLATSGTVTIDQTSLTMVEFTFDGTYTLTASNHYCIAVVVESGYVRWGYDSSSPSHGGNYFSGGTWSANSGRDIAFEVYGSSAAADNIDVPTIAVSTTALTPILNNSNISVPSISLSAIEVLAPVVSAGTSIVSIASRICTISDVEVQIGRNWTYGAKINEQVTFNASLINPTVTITKGLELKYKVNGVVVFAGIIVDYVKIEIGATVLNYDIIAIDFKKICERRFVTEVYVNKSAGYIFADILTKYLADEGITSESYTILVSETTLVSEYTRLSTTTSTIEGGPVFDYIVFNRKSVLDVFNFICENAPGYNWYISVDKKLYFVSKLSYKSVSVVDSTFNHRNFKYNDSLSGYRNVQYVEGGQAETSLQSQYSPTPKPDGVSKEFFVRYPIASEPIIEINLASAGWNTISSDEIGIDTIETGMKFYWSKGVNKITQDTAVLAVLGTSDAIRITYTGLRNILVLLEDNPKILARAAIENESTGKYENVIRDTSITSINAAVMYANALIEKNSKPGIVTFDCLNLGDIAINKLVYVNKPLYGIADWYLCESISASYCDINNIKYSVSLLEGDPQGGWETAFKKLTMPSGTINIENNDTLIKYNSLNETCTISSSTTITGTHSLYVSTTTVVSSTLKLGTLTFTDTVVD